MAGTRSERVERWSEHVDQLCDDGETVERRVELEDATVVVTNRRVLAFTPAAGGPNYRHVERPNVGTVALETSERPGRLCWGIVAAAVGITLVETATAVTAADRVPTPGLEGIGTVPGGDYLARALEAAADAVGTALLIAEWGVLLSGVAAFALAAVLVGSYVRSRSRRLVLRVAGGTDLTLPVADADVEAGRVTALERAVRPDADGREESG